MQSSEVAKTYDIRNWHSRSSSFSIILIEIIVIHCILIRLGDLKRCKIRWQWLLYVESFHCWWIMREIKTSGNSFLCLLINCIMTWHEKNSTSIYSKSLTTVLIWASKISFGLVFFLATSLTGLVLWKIYIAKTVVFIERARNYYLSFFVNCEKLHMKLNKY